MKKQMMLLAWAVFYSIGILQAQSSQASMGFNMMLPMGDMKTGWSSAYGLQGEFLIGLKKVPALKFGLEGSFGMYGYREESQDYLIFNGILATSEVSFSSYVMNLGLKALVEPPKAMPVKPYAAVQFGVLGMSSDLTLDDFSSSDYYYCSSPNQKTLIDDADWYASAGGGLKFDLGAKKNPGRNYIDLYAGYIGGGELKYANMNRLYTTPADPGKHPETIKIVFINTITHEQQEQDVAEVYRHPISMMQIQLKYTFTFGSSRSSSASPIGSASAK